MINYWFPTGIYHSLYTRHDELKCHLLQLVPDQLPSSANKHAEGWPFWNRLNQSDVINPLTITNLQMQEFSYWIENEVNQFSRHYNSSASYKIDQCWLNVYYKGDFQEPHIHPGFDFSAVYFVSTPTDSGKLIFENAQAMSDMRPIKTKKETDLNATAAVYAPMEGQLVIFRSNLRHAVYPHQSDQPRISLAFNLTERG